jgi:hypothetical protein
MTPNLHQRDDGKVLDVMQAQGWRDGGDGGAGLSIGTDCWGAREFTPTHDTEETMTKRQQIKIVREGQYLVEVPVELIDTGEAWSPYLSLEDAYKLDDVREALRRGDLKSAGRLGRVYVLTPVSPDLA